MGRHADPDPRHFWGSLAGAWLRATLALGLVVGLFAALASLGGQVPEDGPVMLGGPGQPHAPGPDPALLAAAPPPSETRVAILHGVGDSPQLPFLVAALEELGYEIAGTEPAPSDHSVTTVLYRPDDEPAARALQARDPRIVQRRPDPTLSGEVDLQVVLGDDWRP